MPGTVQSIVNAAGDIIAQMSNLLETMRRDVAKWEALSPQLDAAFEKVQEATSAIDNLQVEIATLESKKAELQSGLDALRARLGG